MPPIDLVLYHDDADGWCAAWIASHAVPGVELKPVNYGQDPPAVCGRNVLIVDFSYKRLVLQQMHADAASLVVLDHHKTAEDDLAGLDYCHFEMGKAGCRLAWEYFYDRGMLPQRWQSRQRNKPPQIVEYTEDRDLWHFDLHESRAINTAIGSYPQIESWWDELESRAARIDGGLAREGYAILRYQNQIIERHVTEAREVLLTGYRVLAVNASSLFSEIAGTLAHNRPFGVAWFHRGDGKYQFNLRSEPNQVDVSEIARSFGGGGRRNAAGFVSQLSLEMLCDED